MRTLDVVGKNLKLGLNVDFSRIAEQQSLMKLPAFCFDTIRRDIDFPLKHAAGIPADNAFYQLFGIRTGRQMFDISRRIKSCPPVHPIGRVYFCAGLFFRQQHPRFIAGNVGSLLQAKA